MSLQQQFKGKESVSGEFAKGVAFGVINGIMVTPVMISFASIIFRDHAFIPYMPALIKLVLFSSLIHQLCFTLFSSLPFAVGQVQDAGLIFLSSMASSLVSDVSDKQLIPTALFVLCLSTAGLGVMLVLIGKLRLASVVQFLPMPVVGGYLAFIGFFCGQAGLAMMSGIEILTIADWPKMCNEKAIALILPGVLCGCSIYVIMSITRSPFSLPVCMLIMVVVFYSMLGLWGATLQDSRDYGWVAPLSEPLPFYEAWAYYDITEVDWSAFPSQVFRWIGMFLVVAFSSSLDIAAIEMELGLPMDYDRELITVGVSNLCSGLLGGYTGSYIFSQTLFTMRSGINSRVCGYTIVLCEVIVLILPISVTSFIPKFLFGSLLVFIAVDLMYEWLIMSRSKMMLLEYIVCLFTFVAIQYVGIEVGMLLGVLGAMANFVYSYAKKSNVTVTALRFSTAVRTFEERAVLENNRGKIVTISLEGFIFFGSAVKLLEEVKKHVIIGPKTDDETPGESDDIESCATELSPLINGTDKKKTKYVGSPSKSSEHSESFYQLVPHGLTSDQIMAHHNKWKQIGSVSYQRQKELNDDVFTVQDDINFHPSESLVHETTPETVKKKGHHEDYFLPETEIDTAPKNSFESVLLSIWGCQSSYRQSRIESSVHSTPRKSESKLQLAEMHLQSSPKLYDSQYPAQSTKKDAQAVRTEYMILNFTAVSGVDATAARSCFLMLVQLLRGAGATIVFAIPSPESIALLKIHGVILDVDMVFSELEDALEWCEEQVLYRHITERSRTKAYSQELTNYAFSPRPSKASRGINDNQQADACFESLKPAASFDARYMASAWIDRHATPPRKSKCGSSRKVGGYERSSVLVDNRESIDAHKDSEEIGQFDPTPYRVLRRILLDYMEVDPDDTCPTSLKRLLHSPVLARYFARKVYLKDCTVYHIDKAAETLYFIEHGVVELRIPDAANESPETEHNVSTTRVSKISTGGVFGDASFFLSSTYTCSAVVTSEECAVWCLDKKYYAKMEIEYPQLCIIIQHVLLKSMSMAQAAAVHTTYPSNCYSLFFK